MKLKSRNKVTPLFQMASLTDIIFLLLIFFMLTASTVAPNAIDLLLPNADSQVVKNQSITISITENLEYYYNDGGKDEKVPFTALEGRIRQSIAGINDRTPAVVLRLDQGVGVQHLVDVLELGNKTGVNMILATQPRN